MTMPTHPAQPTPPPPPASEAGIHRKWAGAPPAAVQTAAIERARDIWRHFMLRQPPGVDPDGMWSAALGGVLKSFAYEEGHGASYRTWLSTCVRNALKDGLRQGDYLSRSDRERVRRDGPTRPTDYPPLSYEDLSRYDAGDGDEDGGSGGSGGGGDEPMASMAPTAPLDEGFSLPEDDGAFPVSCGEVSQGGDAGGGDLTERAEASRRCARVRAAMAVLQGEDPEGATVLRMRYELDRDRIAVARALGLTAAKVTAAERRALARLKVYLLADPEGPWSAPCPEEEPDDMP